MDKETVDKARKESEEAYLIYINLKAQYQAAEKDWLKKSRRFRDYDYQLALTDGRYKKVPPGGERKPKKQPELSLAQVQDIAQRLGISINLEQPEEPDEETIKAIMEEEGIQQPE